MTVQRMTRALNDITDQLNKRLHAARVASDLIGGTRRPKTIKPLPSQDDEAETHRYLSKILSSGKSRAQAWKEVSGDAFSLNDYADEFPSEFKSKWWRPEVMHLGMALRQETWRWKHPGGFNVFTLVANPGWVVEALNRAEKWALYLYMLGQLIQGLSGVQAERQVRLIPTVAKREPATPQN